jgi:hypothetical protein
MGSIILSTVVNINNIATSVFKGRTGIEKYVFQLIVIITILFIILLVYNLLIYFKNKIGNDELITKINRTFELLTIFMIIYCTFQYINMYHFNIPFFDIIENITRKDGFRYNRIRFVSYEASWFGVNIVPILAFILININRKPKEIKNWLYLFFTYFFIFYSISRTALVICLIMTFVAIILFYIYIKNKETKKILVLVFPLIFSLLVILLTYGNFVIKIENNKVYSIISTLFRYKETVSEQSNLTRYGMTDAAIKMGLNNPLGVGIGQYGFRFKEYFDNIYITYETSRYLSSFITLDYPWPIALNLYARIFAELGFWGIMTFILFYYSLFYRAVMTLKNGKNIKKNDIQILILLMTGCILTGFNYDSFANPVIWFTLAFAMFILTNREIELDKKDPNKSIGV